jgi:CHAT domain-containing protein
MLRLRLSGIALIGCAVVPVARAQALDARATAAAFYAAFASGDERAVAQAWAPSAPDELRRRTLWTMKARCMRLLAVDVTGVQGDEKTASVSVDALLLRRPRNGEEAIESRDGILTLMRSGGRWRVAQWALREEALADAIAAAPDDRARAALLDAEPRADIPLLDRMLARNALSVINNGDDARATAIAALMKRIARENGDRAGESLAFGIDSIILRRQNEEMVVAASVEAGEASLALAERSGDPDALAKALLRLGRAEAANLPGSARNDRFERVLALADDLEDPLPVGTAASRLAALYAERGDHRRALYYAGLTRELAERHGDPLTMAAAELNLAGEYFFNCDAELEREHFSRALAAPGAPDFHRRNDLWIMAHLAGLEARLGHYATFRRLRAEVLKRHDAEGDALTEIYDSDVLVALERGRLAEAESAARKAIGSARDHRIVHRSWVGLARVHLRQHRPHEALRDVEQAKTAAPGFAFNAALVTTDALRQLGRGAEAMTTMRQALAAAEADRALVVSDERQRRMILKDRLDAYVGLVDLLVAQGEQREALSVADQTKGRALLDFLGGSAARLPAMSDEERRTERELAARVSGLNARDSDAAARAKLEHSRTMLDAFRAEIRAKYQPFGKESAAPPELTAAELNALLPRQDMAFLEYVVTGSRLHLFVVRRGAAGARIRVRSVSIASSRLEPAVRRFRDALAAGDLSFEPQAHALYATLLAPVEQDLRGVTMLCIVPDGALWQVPFEALIGPRGTFVAARMATFYAPSIAVYAAMERSRGSRHNGAPSLLAFADPLASGEGAARAAIRSTELAPLPDAEREVSAASACCAHHVVYVGRDALESRVKRESGAFDVIHFATHGVIDDVNPMYSHLLLASDGENDGLLETWEMMRLDLHSELVVLSACDTARGKVGAGEGLIGMSWALFAAGSPSTIATQWKVDSATAADLMIAFYGQWRGRGRTEVAKARALQRARAAIRRDPRRRHPFFWASHVLIGLGD